MSRLDYGKLQGIAAKALASVPQGIITLIQTMPGTGPGYRPGAPSETATALPAAVANGVPKFLVANGLALASDLQVISSVVGGITPKMGDFVVIDGIRYKVVTFEPTPPAGTAVVWKMTVRR